MGYAKDKYTEPEAFKPQKGYRPAAGGNTSRYRRSTSSPGRIVIEPSKKQPLSLSLRLVWMRLKRSLVALRFQANRYTLGIFQRKTMLQVGFVALVAYFMLFAEAGPQIISKEPKQSEQGIAPIEDDPERSSEKPKTKPVKAKTKGEAAPVDASELMSEQAQDYVGRFHDIAVGEMKKFGIPASISLAQGLIESRAGTSKLAVRNNNHFGIKCFSRRCGRGHCTNFTDDTHKDFFRKFKSPWESWRAHSQLIASGRYAKLKQHGNDYRKWAHGLKSLGYATDPYYDRKLIDVINKYSLSRFDE